MNQQKIWYYYWKVCDKIDEEKTEEEVCYELFRNSRYFIAKERF